MAMDFFEHQERARRKTGRLVLLFIAAVVCIIALTYPVIAIAVMMGARGSGGAGSIWQPELLFIVTASVLAVVTIGSLFKLAQLRGGGRVVAESLGGRLVDPGSSDPDERKLLNVVQEMAIASGVPVPPVYLMHDENGINAFAAGFQPEDAVIGVTRGCVQLLDRDELQGVIAHEFSHILNGDMRLNIRLIGVLHGILVIAFIGQMIFRTLLYSGGTRRRSRSRSKDDNGGGIVVILIAAAALMVIGYVGYFFGGLIKAAVSRQREFLADASAVQFTRYPKGIGGALAKIGGHTYDSTVTSPRASEVSHMFFSQGISSWLGAVTATHPPLPERIRRIDPDWDGEFPDTSRVVHAAQHDTARGGGAVSGFAQGQSAAAISGLAGTQASSVESQPVLDLLGSLSDQHVNHAHGLIESIPEELSDAAHSSFSACAVIYAMLIDHDPSIASRQADSIRKLVGHPIADATAKLLPAIKKMNPEARLPLVDMAMPALHELSPAQYTGFKKCVRELVAEDRRIELFEWALSHILIRRLAPAYEAARRVDPRVRYYSLKPMLPHLAVLLSTLARFGHSDPQEVQAAFADGAAQLQLSQAPSLLPESDCGLKQLSFALDALNEVSIREKKKLIHACAACIVSDRRVTSAEGELLRAISDALGCPMPPILPGQPVI